jgi:hypothetical protein
MHRHFEEDITTEASCGQWWPVAKRESQAIYLTGEDQKGVYCFSLLAVNSNEEDELCFGLKTDYKGGYLVVMRKP